MPASLAFERYVDLIGASATRMLKTIESAGFDAEVVTCPTWDGRALIAHQAMVHRWAAANLRGEDASAVPNQTEIRESVDDLATYFREGLDDLVTTLRGAPDDVEALVFLNDAPPAKVFWARRQAHENTIHMVDALSAEVGRVPTVAEAAIDTDVGLDGIDELLCGFFTRGKSRIFDGSEYAVDVIPSDSDRRWTVRVAERMTAIAGSAGDAPVRIAGTAASIYLALWNRGDEVEVTGDDGLLDRWRAAQRVRWG
jgi:uncharacterized protein (TIGR03083 family)